MKQANGGDTVLTVQNCHIKECGEPPGLVAGISGYTAYFENDDGEQLVFQYDREKHQGTLWHGDITWGKPVEIFAGQPVKIILSAEEREWLVLVWRVATRYETAEVKARSALDLAKGKVKLFDSLLEELGFGSSFNDQAIRIERLKWLHEIEKGEVEK